MSTAELYSTYDSFAWFYQKHWSREIPKIFSVVERLLLPSVQVHGRLLDLCCGNGQIAAALTKQGFSVTGIDGSEEMLSYARQNAPGSEFICADARSFRLPTVFDGVISTFDSLNHILQAADLTKVFQRAHAALAPRGLFFFDMNMEDAFRLHWQDYFSMVEEDNICLVRAEYDRDERMGRYHIQTFRLKRKQWQRAEVTILERCYSESEIRAALKKSGFRKVSAFRAEDLGLVDHVGRVFFLARKSIT
jgi:SAM-dependent methyltransferase